MVTNKKLKTSCNRRQTPYDYKDKVNLLETKQRRL